MFLPFIYLFFFFLLETSTSLKTEKHTQPVGSQPDFRMSLKAAEPKLRKEFQLKRKTEFGKGRAGEPNCPNNALCDYTKGKEGMSKIMKTCGDVILIAPFGTIADNPTYIKFLAIPKEHVASAWSITDMKFISNAHQCVKEYLNSPGATDKLQKFVFDACKGDKQCAEQHKKLSTAVGKKSLKFDDFVTYFHVPPGINHLHMHIALADKKFRMFSDAHEDHRCMLSDAVQEELKKSPKPGGGGAGGKIPVPGRMAAGPGPMKAGGMMGRPGMAPAVHRRWNEYRRRELERRLEAEWLPHPSYLEGRSDDLYVYT